VLAMNPELADDLVPVYGKAYGLEAMVKKPAGKLTGWLSYSYSRSRLREMQDRGKETINGGDWYNAPYDKPHEFKLVANYAITHRYSLSMNIDYSTGRPVTIPIGRYYYGGAYRLAYSERNTYRIPDYFRVDAAVNIDPGHYLKALAHASITLGVYNVTGRKNPYSVFFRTTSTGMTNGYILSVFATQIPYINLNILF
ncbi:MAG: TonB-dependent receptor, partial [Bacteroidales bacterium]|nr:TonB-dependent receptor [Bacteroidales bacterium]